RQRDAGQEFDAVLLDELLRLPHRGGRIAGGVLVDELDGPSEDAALGLDVLREQLARALGLKSVLSVAAGQGGGKADLDRIGGPRMTEVGGESEAHPDAGHEAGLHEVTSRRVHAVVLPGTTGMIPRR